MAQIRRFDQLSEILRTNPQTGEVYPPEFGDIDPEVDELPEGHFVIVLSDCEGYVWARETTLTFKWYKISELPNGLLGSRCLLGIETESECLWQLLQSRKQEESLKQISPKI